MKRNDDIRPGGLLELTRVCAWCRRRIGDLDWSYGPALSDAEQRGLQPVTHGICLGCLDEQSEAARTI